MNMRELNIATQAECLFNQAQVDAAIDLLADDISRDFSQKKPILLCVMNGGVVLCAQLMLRLPFAMQFDYVHVSRYRDTQHGGELNWQVEAHRPLQDRVVIVVDDILDEGLTLRAIVENCKELGANEVVSTVLVEKQHQRRVNGIRADYCALTVPDRYVFGYGMDCEGYWRNLAGIYALNE